MHIWNSNTKARSAAIWVCMPCMVLLRQAVTAVTAHNEPPSHLFVLLSGRVQQFPAKHVHIKEHNSHYTSIQQAVDQACEPHL